MLELCRNLDTIIKLEEEAMKRGIFVAYTLAWLEDESKYANARSIVDEELDRSVQLVRKLYTLEKLKDDPIVRAYRDFYWRIGIDPTKTRPASEALVRRALRGSVPKINPIVDAGNAASIETLIPIGIYDLDKLSLPLVITISKGGEIFRPIGGKEEKLSGGIPIMVDSRGIVVHVYPHRDSIDTCVTHETRKVLVLGAGIVGVPRERVEKVVVRCIEILTRIGWNWCSHVVIKPR